MKQPLMMLLAAVLLTAGQVATGSDAQPSATTGQVDVKPAVLTTEQVGALVAERTDAEGNIIRFNASFEKIKKLTAEQKQKHIQSGTIPYRISADAYLFAKTGKRLGLVDGDVHFYMLDADGKMVVTGKSSSKQMCPT